MKWIWHCWNWGVTVFMQAHSQGRFFTPTSEKRSSKINSLFQQKGPDSVSTRMINFFIRKDPISHQNLHYYEHKKPTQLKVWLRTWHVLRHGMWASRVFFWCIFHNGWMDCRDAFHVVLWLHCCVTDKTWLSTKCTHWQRRRGKLQHPKLSRSRYSNRAVTLIQRSVKNQYSLLILQFIAQ